MAGNREEAQRLLGLTLEQRYEVRDLLGEGGTAFVYRAHHQELDIPVALKVLNAKYSGNDNLYAHAQQEARLLARLNHPHIVRALDFFEGAKTTALVLEYIEGRSLSELAHRTPMAWRRACGLVLQCCKAVDALHEQGFAHRDLKPANFMVERHLGEDTETIKMIDLGCAKHLEGGEPLAEGLENNTTMFPATPAYMAPEQARGELARANVCSDTYSLVATLFFCLVGRAPWTGKDTATVMQQVGMEPPFIPEEVHMPAPLRELVLRGLHKDPGQRFATPGELAAELHRVLQPKPAPATRVELVPPTAPPAAASAVPSSRGWTMFMRSTSDVAAAPAPGARRARSPLARAALVGVALSSVVWLMVLVRLGDYRPPLVATLAHEDGAPDVQPPSPARPWAPVSVEPAPSPAPSAAAVSRGAPASPSRQVQRLAPRLRRCPSAPTGPVLLSLDDGLRQVDLAEVDRSDPWHRCAADTLASVTGRARVDLEL